jgi:hypothetical protein
MLPRHASNRIGTIGRITINAIQISNDDIGVRIGPREIGEVYDIIVPTYRFMSGAGVMREIILANVTLRPRRFNSSSLNFTSIQQDLWDTKVVESLFLSQWS